MKKLTAVLAAALMLATSAPLPAQVQRAPRAENLQLPTIDDVDQNALVSAVASANPRTVVVLKNGGPVLMPWLDQVPAVLEAWYPGQEDGNAVAKVLFGVVNPGGKLPISFPVAEREAGAGTTSQWPGERVNEVLTSTYSERLNMAYRWYDANARRSTFPFGFGLSYTSFEFSDLVVSREVNDGRTPIRVQFSVRNTGARAGAEVPQVYVGFPAAAGEPPKRLVALDKVTLAPGESRRVELTVHPMATNYPLSIWNSAEQRWNILDGAYPIYVGNSSVHIPLMDEVIVRTTSQP